MIAGAEGGSGTRPEAEAAAAGRAVRVLPPALADQIAAGEVVERPASVVKELVENALDAGATRVEIAVDGGGVTAIRVADDGAGMSRQDAATAVLRHATSKIAAPEDLAGIRTLGFRGEALPSIAAVSRLVITTRLRDGGVEGTVVRVEGGGPADVRPAGAPPGTSVEARDLFFNTPARRKFLRGELAEKRALIDVVTRVALARPEVGFVLELDGRAVVEAPPVGDGVEAAAARVRQVLGSGDATPVFPFESTRGRVRVRGFLGRPDRSRARPDQIYLYVNERPVRDRSLQQAVAVGYARVLERGRWPAAVVLVSLPVEDVDVNVHPTKSEVRFLDARAVFEAVRGAVERAVAEAPWASEGARGSAGWTGWGSPRPLLPPSPLGAPPAALPERGLRHQAEELPLRPSGGGAEGVAERAGAYGAGAETTPGETLAGDACARALRTESTSPETGFYASLRVVGQVKRTYLVCEGPAGLYLVDQHAGHERILFERLRRARDAKQVAVQPLLLPAVVELPPALAAAAEEAGPLLAAMGLELEHFGGTSWRVQAIPAALGRASPAVLAREALEEIADESGIPGLGDRTDAALARMACHGATRAGDFLDREEATRLLADLDCVPNRGHCPHGRPVFVEITFAELERRTGRA